MASSKSPGKITLGMMKGKSITTSVPVIRYHASDDELEELYPSSDDEKQQTPESEKTSPKTSPFKSSKSKTDNESNDEHHHEKRSSSLDLSEGTPPSDPWKMLSDIRGKITKTLEEKISEMKNEKKDKNKTQSMENSSVSDSEDLGDITPTEDSLLEEENNFDSSPKLRKRKGSSRFRFSTIKTGFKTKNTKEDNVESGIEAAESIDVQGSSFSISNEQEESTEISSTLTVQSSLQRQSYKINSNRTSNLDKQQKLFSELKTQILCHAILLPVVICAFYYLVPFPKYINGVCAGIVVAITIQKVVTKIKDVLEMPIATSDSAEPPISVVEILAAEEYAVLERFEGWLNELPYDYNPENYHVARTNSVFFKLEGETLRIMETRTRVPKRAVCNEAHLTAKFTRKRVYSLVGAKVELLPEGLTRRRRWSKKYPICVTFGREGIIENAALETPSDDEHVSDLEKDKLIAEEDETDEDSSISKDIKNIFEDCHDDEDELRSKIFIFGRTDRQKEDWYRRLILATRSSNKRNSIPSTKELTSSPSSVSLSQTPGDSKISNSTSTSLETPSELSYGTYMSRYIDGQSTPTTESRNSISDNDSLWLNAILGRILFDMHKCPDMINVIQDKIQRKLSNIKLPYFMESLIISELVIGQGAPYIHKATKPTVDERGLWIDLDMSYECNMTMTVETKLNLMKLTKAGSMSNNPIDNSCSDEPKPARSPMFDDDVEDSPETSTEDEDSIQMPPNTSRESTPTQSSGRKFLSMVDKLASNKYFQHAAELSYVRRAMEGVSNTEIRLMVSVSSIEGCLSVNIPPPPSDRFWYGFKPTPKIHLDARPAVGERAVNIGYVTNLIKTKLLKEFEKVVVLPNMDDLVIPLCPNFPYHED